MFMKIDRYQGKPKRQRLNDIASSGRERVTTEEYENRVEATATTGNVAQENDHQLSPTLTDDGRSMYE